MLVFGRMSSTIIWRMASKSWRLSPGSKKDGSENGISSAGTVRDPPLSLAVWLFLKFNTKRPRLFWSFLARLQDKRIDYSATASLYRVAEADPCEGSTRRNQAGLLAKA